MTSLSATEIVPDILCLFNLLSFVCVLLFTYLYTAAFRHKVNVDGITGIVLKYQAGSWTNIHIHTYIHITLLDWGVFV